MKLITSLLIPILCSSLMAPAQEIAFNALYQLEVNSKCSMTATVDRQKRMVVKMNKSTLRGKLVVNKHQPRSYNFYIRNRFRFVVVFGKDEQGDYLFISNAEYLKMFFQSDDRKGFALYPANS